MKNIPEGVTIFDIYRIGKQFGTVMDAYLMKDKAEGIIVMKTMDQVLAMVDFFAFNAAILKTPIVMEWIPQH